MTGNPPAYGLWFLALVNAGIFILFALSFFKPTTARDWRSLGALKEGARADVTVIDLEEIRRVDVNEWRSKARICPWSGEMLQGWPVLTLVDGHIRMNRLEDGE